jgi:hypothetical protein
LAAGTSPRAAAAATAATPRKIAPRQKCSSIAPDQTIEIATDPPATYAQMAIALGRSAGGNNVARMDSVPGMTSAAPTPMTPGLH